MIEKWYDGNNEKVYLALVVGNIFADSYIKGAAKERLYVAKQKKNLKRINIKIKRM